MEEMNVYKKLKKIVKEHKIELLEIGALSLAGGLCIGLYTSHAYQKGYERGYRIGGCVGLSATIAWFDETFPDLNLYELYETYIKNHPDQLVSFEDYIAGKN